MALIRQSPEVYLASGDVVTIGPPEIAMIEEAVALSPRGRVRINTHPNLADSLHEMFIAIRPDSYIRPHKHLNKSESFHLVHGAVDVVIFDDSGTICEIVALIAGGPGAFFYRLSAPLFHTLLIRSHLLVMHETTNGPFEPGATVPAPFAPAEHEVVAAAAYRAALSRQSEGFIGASR